MLNGSTSFMSVSNNFGDLRSMCFTYWKTTDDKSSYREVFNVSKIMHRPITLCLAHRFIHWTHVAWVNIQANSWWRILALTFFLCSHIKLTWIIQYMVLRSWWEIQGKHHSFSMGETSFLVQTQISAGCTSLRVKPQNSSHRQQQALDSSALPDNNSPGFDQELVSQQFPNSQEMC